MNIYAEINAGKVVNTVVANASFISNKSGVFVDVTNLSPRPGVGWGYDGVTFTAPPEKTNTQTIINLTVTSLTSSDVNSFSNSQNEITSIAGATISASVSLDTPLNSTFRVPFSNGSETRYLLAKFINGQATIQTVVNKSGLWKITSQAVNKNMQQGVYFSFNDINIYIVQ